MIKIGFYFCVFLIITVESSCPTIPGGRVGPKTTGDGGFKITLNGNPEKYVPKSVYKVLIEGNNFFSRFILTADAFPSNGSEASPQRVGSFQLFAGSPDTGFKSDCINTISEVKEDLKKQIEVIWTAPKRGSGCVVLRSMVYIDGYRWYADDGQLSLTICEVTETTVKPKSVQCCACDEAKYKLIFEGLWSASTHPKDFPFSLWLTHFSDVIGGSHGQNFSFWGEGQIASDALRQVAEWGSVGAMEKELRLNGRYLRTLIKAAGLWYPKVNTNTSSSFRVDRSKHLVSLVSMFGPSPDWIVGVSGLNLCLTNCTWIENQVIDLYPYDAGTDNGITYMSPNSPTMPQDPIKRITSMYPEDPRAPFHDPTGIEMKPLARLYLIREKLITKSCSEKTEDELFEEINFTENSEDSLRKECEVTEYSEWSQCSVTCGKGLRSRERRYSNPGAAERAHCDRQLISKEMCVAANPTCPGDEEEVDTINAFNDTICAVTDWDDWSECTSTCGEGVKIRNRRFKNRLGMKRCSHVTVKETVKCMEPPCSQPLEVADPQCPITDWSDWSPCSVSCGPGLRVRTRQLLVDPTLKEFCTARVQLVQQHPCTGKKDCAIDMATAKVICMEQAHGGPCRGYFPRWAFNTMKAMCVPFTYGGCRGNKNNFITEEECIQTCAVVRDNLLQGARSNTTSSLGPKPITGDPVNCVVSLWSAWSQCSVSCGEGYKERKRTIIVEPKNGGHACPRTMTRRRRCQGLHCNLK
uniref:Spondin-1 n=1 Tax=Clastoptera arizonana TaxID=38151 RepID=A0A1B6CP24_9HEMI